MIRVGVGVDGFMTVEHARDDYGVILDEVGDGYGWALNAEATRAHRAALAVLDAGQLEKRRCRLDRIYQRV